MHAFSNDIRICGIVTLIQNNLTIFISDPETDFAILYTRCGKISGTFYPVDKESLQNFIHNIRHDVKHTSCAMSLGL